MRKILLTGASGKIGSLFYETYKDKYEFILTDIRHPSYTIKNNHQFIIADLSSRSNIALLFNGVTDVVHLAGIPSPTATFQEILPANILATTYLFEFAAEYGVRRFIFASSAQTIEGYPVDKQINSSTPINPANLYGVSKCYGEALGAYYSNISQMSVIVLRIAAFEYLEDNALLNGRDLSAWLSPRDAMQLLEKSIEVDGIHFFIGFGISNNRFKRFDITETCKTLNYTPIDDAFELYDLSLIRK